MKKCLCTPSAQEIKRTDINRKHVVDIVCDQCGVTLFDNEEEKTKFLELINKKPPIREFEPMKPIEQREYLKNKEARIKQLMRDEGIGYKKAKKFLATKKCSK